MKTLVRTVFCVLLLAGWGLAALSLHVVRTPTSISLVPKNKLGVVDTYVDTRHWTMTDAADHPLVVNRIVETGQADLLRHITGEDGDRLAGDLKKATRNKQTENASTFDSLKKAVASAAPSTKDWWDLP